MDTPPDGNRRARKNNYYISLSGRSQGDDEIMFERRVKDKEKNQ